MVKVVSCIVVEMVKLFVIEGYELFVIASLGIVVHLEDGGDVDMLLKNVDVVMYSVKDMGCNNYKFYLSEFNVWVLE